MSSRARYGTIVCCLSVSVAKARLATHYCITVAANGGARFLLLYNKQSYFRHCSGIAFSSTFYLCSGSARGGRTGSDCMALLRISAGTPRQQLRLLTSPCYVRVCTSTNVPPMRRDVVREEHDDDERRGRPLGSIA